MLASKEENWSPRFVMAWELGWVVSSISQSISMSRSMAGSINAIDMV